MDTVVSSLRALVISRKEAITLQQLIADYEEIEGVALNVKQFGFDTVKDFLQACGKFILKPTSNGATQVIPVADERTAHIENMVAKQKSTKRRPAAAAVGAPKTSKKKPPKQIPAPPPPKQIPAPPPPLNNNSKKNQMNPANNNNNNKRKNQQRNFNFNQSWHQFNANFNNGWNPFAQGMVSQAEATLNLYCMFMKICPPLFNVYTAPNIYGFLAAVIVGGVTYSTNGRSFPSPAEARMVCSHIALEHIYGC